MKLLNVGGGSKTISIPQFYKGCEHILLDIDPKHGPDIVADARELTQLPPKQFDVVYCAHNLEHYYRHEVPKVLAGFQHVLKDDGFAHIFVPNVGLVMKLFVGNQMDIDDVLYQSPSGPIAVHDVIYGFGKEIAESGSPFYAHKTGFTPSLLGRVLQNAGFQKVLVNIRNDALEIEAVAFKSMSSEIPCRLIS
jgi:SAM-dependent methyltransferase